MTEEVKTTGAAEQETNVEQTQPAQQEATVSEDAAVIDSAAQPDAETELPIAVIDYDEADEQEYDSSAASQTRKRLHATEGVSEQARYKRGKLTFKEAVATFFYLNKLYLVIGTVALITIAVLVISSIPEKIDYDVLLLVDHAITDETIYEDINAELAQYGEDIDGNGIVNFDVAYYQATSANPAFSEDYTSVISSMVFLNSEFDDGQHDNMLIFSDTIHYDLLCETYTENVFDTLDGMPRRISLEGTALGDLFESYGIEDIGVSLVALTDKMAKDEDMVARHDQAAAFLSAYCAANDLPAKD